MYKITYIISKLLLNTIYIIYLIIMPKANGINKNNNDEEIIVSLTTYPERIKYVWITIETLLRQTYKPNKIILWLAKEQFDSLENLPQNLLKQRSRGLEIRFCEDLRSHKKYYYAMKENPNSIIITVDDDMFYPESLVENLLNKHKEFPNAICCNWAHVINIKSKEICNYNLWLKGVDGYTLPTKELVPIGCEGILYPPNSLNKLVFNKSDILNLCLNADDLWLKSMELLNDKLAVRCSKVSIPYSNIMISQKTRLNKNNVDENKNSIQFKNIISKYPEILDKLKKNNI